MKNIENLKSFKVFKFFEEISKIPHGSYNEKEISEYLINFAKERNLYYYTDKLFNVIIKKEGCLGLENANTIALQGHIDMVCEKNKDVEHDFLKDAIKLIYDGDILKAKGTTLGADNGICVAMALALLDAKDIPHPPLEAIFTTSEETGMEGAISLDKSKIDAKVLLNLDSEDEGIFTVGCAGGVKATISFPIFKITANKDFSFYTLSIGGLFGGHSGVDINKGRANANKLLIKTLKILKDNFNINITSIFGGFKDNAIPREADAIISFDRKYFNDIKNCLMQINETLRQEYELENDININIIESNKSEHCLSDESFDKILDIMYLIPSGVYSTNYTLNLPESSINIGAISIDKDTFKITLSIRSSLISKKEELIEYLKIICKYLKADIKFKGDYPAWEYNKNSNITKKCIEIYKDMTGKEAKIEIIHAGLECGVFIKALPHLDIISFGPNIYNPHSPNEYVSITSVDRVWAFLLSLIKQI